MNLAFLEEIEFALKDTPVCVGWCNEPIRKPSWCEKTHWFDVWGSGDVKVDSRFVCLECCYEYHRLCSEPDPDRKHDEMMNGDWDEF